MTTFKARWREIAAFLAAAIIVAGGTYLAFTVKEVWLNRAGALVIIIGVILAASRVNEVLSAKVAAFVEVNFDRVFSETLASLEHSIRKGSSSPMTTYGTTSSVTKRRSKPLLNRQTQQLKRKPSTT